MRLLNEYKGSARARHDAAVQLLLDVALLRRRQFVIEHDQVRRVLIMPRAIRRFAGADEPAGVRALPAAREQCELLNVPRRNSSTRNFQRYVVLREADMGKTTHGGFGASKLMLRHHQDALRANATSCIRWCYAMFRTRESVADLTD